MDTTETTRYNTHQWPLGKKALLGNPEDVCSSFFTVAMASTIGTGNLAVVDRRQQY
jgi:hypothetical protein